MRYYVVSPLKVTHAREAELTYSFEHELPAGSIVAVEVGRTTVPAIVLRSCDKPAFDTKPIISLVEQAPLPQPLVTLHKWLCDYYVSHPVATWRTLLPSGLLKKRRANTHTPTSIQRTQEDIVFTTDQQHAIDGIMQMQEGTSLLHGVTGSGKTAVYIELAKQTIAQGRSVIILVPEIALTSQLVAEFTPHFETVHVTHSTMTEAARHSLWRDILAAETPRVIIGPRSALFMPLNNLGLIVIDECHEPAYKQEKAPRYSALRTASMLARYHHARLVLGSATPNVADYYLATATTSPIFHLKTPARTDTITPTATLVDMTKRANFTRSPFLSNQLLQGIERSLSNGTQALIFHNRRGSAPITLCEQCGWSASCPRCYIPLTLHADEYRLRCHLCNHVEKIPLNCPSCHHTAIIHKGIGTKRVADELQRFFPDARIERFDGDNKQGVDAQYQSLYDGDIDIIIGTQVVAKGLDLPKLRFVGVVQADSGLSLPDYQSSERVFQLLAQVTGRVGRNEHHSHVVIQSYQPTHPSVAFGLSQDYSGFYEWCLAERQRAQFPPFVHLLRATAIYKTEAGAIRASQQVVAKLRAAAPPDTQIIGPAPAFYERLRDTYRWQVIVKSASRASLIQLLSSIPEQGWQTELDPMNLL